MKVPPVSWPAQALALAPVQRRGTCAAIEFRWTAAPCLHGPTHTRVRS